MSIKKRILASIVVASAIWAGSTAYISGNTEKYLNNYVTNSNKIYANNGMKMSILSFKKGFVNSHAKVSVDFTDPQIKKELEEVLKLPIVMDYDIENGPILLKDGLSVGASRIHSKLNVSKLFVDKNEFKKVVKDDIVLNTTMLIDFQNHIDYKAKSNKIVAEDNNTKFTISPLEVNGEMNGDSLSGTVNMITKSIYGDIDNKAEIKLENVTLNGDIKKFFDNGFYLGNFDMGVDNFTVNDKYNKEQNIKNAKVKVAMDIKQNSSNLIDTNFKLNLDIGDTKLPPEINFLKTIALNYGLNGTKMEAWLAFQDTIKEVQEKQKKILEKLSTSKDIKEQEKAFKDLQNMQQEVQNKMVSLLSDFLVKDKTSFNLNANINSGQGKAMFDIKYIGDEQLPKNLDELVTKLQQEILNWIKLNIDIKLDKSLANKLPQELQSQLAIAMMTGMIQDNNTSYDFNANYVPKKLIVNGQDKSSMIMLLEGLQGVQ